MKDQFKSQIHRRDLLHVLALGAAATSGLQVAAAAPRAPVPPKDRRARYGADSPEVQTFYRVNRYPAK